MILDRSDWIFTPTDLHNEWLRKIDQFKKAMADIGKKADSMASLIRLGTHICASEMSHYLFPGEKLNMLMIQNTVNGKIDPGMDLRVELKGVHYDNIVLSFYKRSSEAGSYHLTWTHTCHEDDLLETFENFMQTNAAFARRSTE